MSRLPMFDCDVLDARDLQGLTCYVIKNEETGKVELHADGARIAVATRIGSLTKYAHGEHCAVVRIDSSIEDP